MSPVHPFSVFSPKPPWELSRSGTHLSNIRHIQQFPKHVDTRGLQHLVDECGQRCPLGGLGQKQKLLLVLPCHLDFGTHVGDELGGPGLRKSGAARKEDGKLESTRPRGWIAEAMSHFVTTEQPSYLRNPKISHFDGTLADKALSRPPPPCLSLSPNPTTCTPWNSKAQVSVGEGMSHSVHPKDDAPPNIQCAPQVPHTT